MKAAATSKKTRVKPEEARTLDAAAWAQEGLSVLATHGIDRVRVEVLAKQLGVTKGSFYWHFKDRDELLATMLDQWRKRATLGLIERLDSAGAAPKDRMRKLLRLPIKGKRSALGAEIELAIRLWARHDTRAAQTLGEIDQIRLKYIAQLLTQMGAAPAEAKARAILAYSYLRVAPSLPASDSGAMMQRCEDILIGR